MIVSTFSNFKHMAESNDKGGTSAPRPPEPVDEVAQYRAAWGDYNTPGEIEKQDRVMAISESIRSIVYQQKYAQFRHYDTLRWQIPGLVFAVGGALFTLGKTASGLPHFLAIALYGLFAIAGAFVMGRIRHHLRANDRILRRFAMSFGDFGVLPPPGKRSASTRMQFLLNVVGYGSLALALARIVGWAE